MTTYSALALYASITLLDISDISSKIEGNLINTYI
jgi:hypothetical protein